jgi:hypothetical protein
MRRSFVLFLAPALGCLPADRGSAIGRVILPQTVTTVAALRVGVIDGAVLPAGCAAPVANLRAAPRLSSGEFPIDARSGRIDNIPAGPNRIFFFEALAGAARDRLVAVGCRDRVLIQGGAVSDLGRVFLAPAPGVALTFEPQPDSAKVGDTVTLVGEGFANDVECIEVAFRGENAAGNSAPRSATVLFATPTQVSVRVPGGALTGPIQASVRATCAGSALTAESSRPFRVVPSIDSIVYSPAACEGGAAASGGRHGEVVELRGSGFSPVAEANRIQITGFTAVRAIWATSQKDLGGIVQDAIRFVVPPGLPAGTLPIAVSVETAGDPNPPLSASVTFRVLPTLREVRPTAAPSGGTVRLDVQGASANESANLITFRYATQSGSGTALTFPTRVEAGDLAVIVPNGVAAGTVNVAVEGECSNERPFFRANILGALPARMPQPPGAGATVAISPTVAHLGGVLGGASTVAWVTSLGAAIETQVYGLSSPAGPVFADDGRSAFFLERGAAKLHRIDLTQAGLPRTEVALSPPLGTPTPGTPLVQRGRFLYALEDGATQNIVRIDPVQRTTRRLFGASTCTTNGIPVDFRDARNLVAAPAADLLVAIQEATPGLTSGAVLVLNPSDDTGCFAAPLPPPAPTRAVAFEPGKAVAYFASGANENLRRVSFAFGTSQTILVVENLPARLPAGAERLMVTPDGAVLLAFAGTARPAELGAERKLAELVAVDLRQGGTNVPLSDRARQQFGEVDVDAVRVSHDSKTLYVPAQRIDPVTREARDATLFHVDLDAFLADTEGSGVGVSAQSYARTGAVRASALAPDSSFLLLLRREEGPNIALTGNLYTFLQRPRGPYRFAVFTDDFHGDAALTSDERHLLALLPGEPDSRVRFFRVGPWDFDPSKDLALPGFAASPRIFASPFEDVAVVIEAGAQESAGDTRRVCLLRNLSRGPATSCPVVAGAGPAQRVEFGPGIAILYTRGGLELQVLDLAVPDPVPRSVPFTVPFSDVFGIPGTKRAFVIHRPILGTPAAVSLVDFASGTSLGSAVLSGTPGLASVDPAGARLIVPLVDSPFVDLVVPTSTGPWVRRMATFGGIHLSASFHSRPEAMLPASPLVAYAFDVLRDGITRFAFSEDRTDDDGTPIAGYAVATGTLPIDRSTRVGLTDADIQMISSAVNDRFSPQVLSGDGRTMWISTGEGADVVAVDAAVGQVAARVPLPGSFPQPRQLLPTRDRRWVAVRDVHSGVLHVVDAAPLVLP